MIAPRAPEREAMVREQLRGRDIVDGSVLRAMLAVPRHRFVPDALQRFAYDDRPLAVGHDATISQPYIVALMLQLAGIGAGARVLDVGTGSGYQAAVAAELGAHVFGIERVPELAVRARQILTELGRPIDVATGDGWHGRPELAPFDAILVAAAPPTLPVALADQLAPTGRLVIPIGERGGQQLSVFTRGPGGVAKREITSVSFVPLVPGDVGAVD